MGNISQIQTMFLNLILNAKDAMGRNGQLIFSTQEIKSQSKKTHYVEITIKDTGKGISSDNIKHIFDL